MKAKIDPSWLKRSFVAAVLEHIQQTTRHIRSWNPVPETIGKFKVTTFENVDIPVLEVMIETKRKKRHFVLERELIRRKILVVVVKVNDKIDRLVGRVIHLIKKITDRITRERARQARAQHKKKHFCIHPAAACQ